MHGNTPFGVGGLGLDGAAETSLGHDASSSRSRSRSRSSFYPGRDTTTDAQAAVALLPPEQQALVKLLEKELASKELEQLKQARGAANDLNVSTGVPIVAAAPPTLLYQVSAEVHKASFEEDYPIHPEISILFDVGIRTPLTLFTKKALRTLQYDASAYRKKRTIGQRSLYLLDTSAFGREDEMSLQDWKVAFPNYITFLGSVADAPICERWRQHFARLAALESLEECFDTLLQFDIDERCKYHARPFAFNPEIYFRNLDQACDKSSEQRRAGRVDQLNSEVSRLLDELSGEYAPVDDLRNQGQDLVDWPDFEG